MNELLKPLMGYAAIKAKKIIDTMQEDMITDRNKSQNKLVDSISIDVKEINGYIDIIQKLATEELAVAKRSYASSYRQLSLQKIIANCTYIKLRTSCVDTHCRELKNG